MGTCPRGERALTVLAQEEIGDGESLRYFLPKVAWLGRCICLSPCTEIAPLFSTKSRLVRPLYMFIPLYRYIAFAIAMP